MKEKAKPFLEYFSESTTACLVTMVQGNMLLMTLGHVAVAAETGIFAGGTTLLVTIFAKVNQRWLIALVLGIVTFIVDLLVHPGMFGAGATEAIVTGIAAGVLSYIVGKLVNIIQNRRKSS